jgi:hypothetical protein
MTPYTQFEPKNETLLIIFDAIINDLIVEPGFLQFYIRRTMTYHSIILIKSSFKGKLICLSLEVPPIFRHSSKEKNTQNIPCK